MIERMIAMITSRIGFIVLDAVLAIAWLSAAPGLLTILLINQLKGFAWDNWAGTVWNKSVVDLQDNWAGRVCVGLARAFLDRKTLKYHRL